MSLPSLKSRPILSSRYQSKWGLWEAFREFYCNSLDADPSGNILDITKSGTTCTFYTRTAPTLAQLSIIGEGTKDSDTGTIGQFGEGFKLAALTILRNAGTVTVRTPTFSAHFSLVSEEGASAPILYIHPRRIAPAQSKPGCLVTVSCPAARFNDYRTYFCDPALTTIPQASPDSTRIFFRGVFITKLTKPALFDYNFSSLTINRDRSVPDHYSLLLNLLSLLPPSSARALLTSSSLLEHEALDTYWSYTNKALRLALLSEYRSLYGDKAVLPHPTDPTVNEAATIRGFTCCSVPCEGIAQILRELGVQDALSVLPTDHKFTEVIHPHAATLSPILLTHWKNLALPGSLCVKYHDGPDFMLVPSPDSSVPHTLWLSSAITHPRTAVACFLSACSSLYTKPGTLASAGSIAAMAASLLHPAE